MGNRLFGSLKRRPLRRALVLQALAALVLAAAGIQILGLRGAEAAFTKYDSQTYDLDTLGMPKFVNTIYIDLRKITALSKFRSNAGHDYSDTSQFNLQAYRDPVTHLIAGCSSMKHYFMSPDASTAIYAPVSGVVARMFDEQIGGTQIQIVSDIQPAFTFTMFHVVLTKPLAEGDHVTEGEVIGHHVGTQTWSDMAVAVHTPTGYHLVSYFETLTDTAFAALKARGVAAPADLILSQEYRKAYPVFYCATSTSPQPPTSEVVQLTGGATTQTINVPVNPPSIAFIGDAPVTLSATATSGLPVAITTREPKVCRFENGVLTWRRPGTCTVNFSQAGNDGVFAAPTRQFTVTVFEQGASTLNVRPYLGGIYPPAQGDIQSYLRFYNAGGAAGTVTASLINGDTGAVAATWTSSSIASHRVLQVPIGTLEAAATSAPTSRPSVYGIRIEANTTMYGYMQHVLFDSAGGGITNASSCKTGTVGTPKAVPFMYSSLFSDYASMLVLANPSDGDYSFNLDAYLALSGTKFGNTASYPFIARELQGVEPAGHYVLPESAIETRFSATPPVSDPILAVQTNTVPYLSGYIQHLVASKRANVAADMSAACNLSGSAQTTVASPLFTAHVLPASSTAGSATGSTTGSIAGRSYFRLYNAGTSAGTATVTLRDPATGFVLGQGTTPSIAPGAAYQYAVEAIEAAPGFTKKALYTATVETAMDGYFQHVTYRAPDGALSNFSTCSGSVTVGGALLMGVHSSLIAAAGYPSTVIVNNTGDAPAAVVLDLFDAQDGRLLTSFTTTAIPASGQLRLDVAAIERAAGYTPTSGVGHYVVKARGGSGEVFNGYLQHYVTNTTAGVVSDMTAMCGM